MTDSLPAASNPGSRMLFGLQKVLLKEERGKEKKKKEGKREAGVRREVEGGFPADP